MADRIIELRWTCGECGTSDILGRHKACPSCGAARERGEIHMDVGSTDSDGTHPAATVTDRELLDLATAGADWFCAFCSAGNRGDGDRCASCGASRREERVPTPRTPVRPAPARRWHRWVFLAVGVVVGFVALCLGGARWLWATHDVVGEVTALHWVHTTERQTWTKVTKSAFRQDIRERAARPPVDGGGEVAGARVLSGTCRDAHHHDERYACGTERVCRPKTRSESYECGETCTSNDNGFATCSPRMCTRSVPDGETCHDETKYCSRPVFAAYCDYETWQWRRVESAVARGDGTTTRWEALSAGKLDRIRRYGEYEVVIGYDDHGESASHTLEPDTLGAYRSWRVGETVTLELGRFGGVRGVQRAGSQSVAGG